MKADFIVDGMEVILYGNAMHIHAQFVLLLNFI